MTDLSNQQRYRTISRVNWLCTGVDAILTILKLIVGLLTRSPALLADALHSLSDLGTDLLVLLFARLARQGPDASHPYGHARYETAGTAILGAALLVLAVGIAFDNSLALATGKTTEPHWISLAVAALSIISKEVLFHYTLYYAKKIDSKLLTANAWHSRSDSLSSLAVFIGVLFALAGFTFVEHIAALAVALLIGHMGGQLAWNALQDLIDRSVPASQLASYQQTLSSDDNILDVHAMRSRLMGTHVMLDAHIVVAPRLSVSEAHRINDFAIAQLKAAHPEIQDVTLHIDFSVTEAADQVHQQPLRTEILEQLQASGIDNFEHMYLHYQENQVTVELIFSEKKWHDNLIEKIKKSEQDIGFINSIEVLIKK